MGIPSQVALCTVVMGLVGAAQPAPKKTLEMGDMNRIAAVSSPAASADGQWIAYVVKTADGKADHFLSTVWVRHWDGSGAREIRPAPGQSAWQPAFLPDSSGVAFLSDAGEKHVTQVWVAPLVGGAPRAVTSLAAAVEDYSLAPDGRHIALAADAGGPEEGEERAPIVIDRFLFKDDDRGYMTARRRHLFVADLQTRQATQITHGEFDVFFPAWSPDGAHIAYVSRHEEERGRPLGYDVFVVDALTGANERRVTDPRVINNDPDHESRFAWSPDGRRIAYIEGGIEKWLEYWPWELVVADIDSGKRQRIGLPERGYTHPAFSGDGKAVFALLEQDRNTVLSRIEIEGNRMRELDQGRRFDFDLAVGPGERALLVTGDDTHPYRISVIDAKGETFLPGHNDWLDEYAIAPTEEISFKSQDGTEIHGFLVKPLGYEAGKRYPTFFHLHGGPQYQFSHEFMFEWQVFASHGYAVVGVNPRGSSGRGFKFSLGIFNDWGHLDVQDILAATDFAEQTGVADPQRLGVGGWSYGGYLTDYVIASTHRYRAAVSGAGSGNILAMYGTDEYTGWLEAEVGKPWKDFDNYVRLSYPFLHSDRIATPTLFLCGQIDFNVPCIGGEQMYQALKSNGVPTELVIYPGMHHTPDTPAFTEDRVARYLNWMEKYLK